MDRAARLGAGRPDRGAGMPARGFSRLSTRGSPITLDPGFVRSRASPMLGGVASDSRGRVARASVCRGAARRPPRRLRRRREPVNRHGRGEPWDRGDRANTGVPGTRTRSDAGEGRAARRRLWRPMSDRTGHLSRGGAHPDRRAAWTGRAAGTRPGVAVSNPKNLRGRLGDALDGADLFVGLSVPGVLTVRDLKRMGRDPIVFAMANPIPEIQPESAGRHVRVIATGRSDYPNQINRVLCFPGFFRGLLDSRARTVNDEMKIAAAGAIAATVSASEVGTEYIITERVQQERGSRGGARSGAGSGADRCRLEPPRRRASWLLARTIS